MSITITRRQLGELLTSPIPAIAVSFADQTSEDDFAAARTEGLDVFELRIDRYASTEVGDVIAEVRRFANVPTIATIRITDEGGEWNGTSEDRLELFRAVIPYVDAVDIELASSDILPHVVAAARADKKLVIVSNHNFDDTPSADELLAMATEARELGADFVKLSAMANSVKDVRTLAQFTLQNEAMNLIVIAMGAHGTASRVFFPALGSRLTYAYSSSWPVSGQLTYQQTFNELRQFYPEFNERKTIDLELLEGA